MKAQLSLVLPLVLSAGCAVYFRPVPPPPPVTATVTVGPEAPPPPPPPAEAPPPPEPAAEAPPPPPEQTADTYDDQDPTALQDFHTALDGHGSWVDDPTYGYVWVPNPGEVGADFTPYVSGGHWVYGEDNLWVSDYGWGWAPFHYGRWAFTDMHGWAWIPGRQYAPAWVEWRLGDEYLGWAPAGPDFIWRNGVAVTVGFRPPPPRYVFVGHADFYSNHPGRVVIMGPRAREYEGRTRVYEGGGGGGRFRRGPTPTAMHLPPGKVVRATGHEPGLAHAQTFAHPSTAQKVGGHPPVKRVAVAETHGQERTHTESGHATKEPTKEPGVKEPATKESASKEPGNKEPALHPGEESTQAGHEATTHPEPTQKGPTRETSVGEPAHEAENREAPAHPAPAAHAPAPASHAPTAAPKPSKKK